MEAILPVRSLPRADFAKINATRERCDVLVAKAQRKHDKLRAAADREEDWRRARQLRQHAREILQAAQSEAAVRILDAQAEAYLPLVGDHFRYQTLEILATASASLYGGDTSKVVTDAVADRVGEWRARSWEREAAAAPEKGGPPGAQAARKNVGRRAGTKVDCQKLRLYRGKWSQQDFAEKCDVSLTTIQRGEVGGRWGDGTFDKVADTITKLTERRVTPEDLKNSRK